MGSPSCDRAFTYFINSTVAGPKHCCNLLRHREYLFPNVVQVHIHRSTWEFLPQLLGFVKRLARKTLLFVHSGGQLLGLSTLVLTGSTRVTPEVLVLRNSASFCDSALTSGSFSVVTLFWTLEVQPGEKATVFFVRWSLVILCNLAREARRAEPKMA
eukprot:3644412-Amphidinium_carterae.4